MLLLGRQFPDPRIAACSKALREVRSDLDAAMDGLDARCQFQGLDIGVDHDVLNASDLTLLMHHAPNSIAATTTYAHHRYTGYCPTTITRFHYLVHLSASPSCFVVFPHQSLRRRKVVYSHLRHSATTANVSFDLRFSTRSPRPSD
jgi:hypothetical protein